MFDSNDGLAVGAAGIILHTTDGGASWSKTGGGVQSFLMRGVDFSDSRRGVVVASQDPNPDNMFPNSRLYYTTDGGTTWDFSLIGFRLFDVAFADATTARRIASSEYRSRRFSLASILSTSRNSLLTFASVRLFVRQ